MVSREEHLSKEDKKLGKLNIILRSPKREVEEEVFESVRLSSLSVEEDADEEAKGGGGQEEEKDDVPLFLRNEKVIFDGEGEREEVAVDLLSLTSSSSSLPPDDE